MNQGVGLGTADPRFYKTHCLLVHHQSDLLQLHVHWAELRHDGLVNLVHGPKNVHEHGLHTRAAAIVQGHNVTFRDNHGALLLGGVDATASTTQDGTVDKLPQDSTVRRRPPLGSACRLAEAVGAEHGHEHAAPLLSAGVIQA